MNEQNWLGLLVGLFIIIFFSLIVPALRTFTASVVFKISYLVWKKRQEEKTEEDFKNEAINMAN